MADLAITPANVTYTDGAISKQELVAGETITAGQPLYVDTTNSNVAMLTQSDGVALEATAKGIALNGAAATQPVNIAVSGDMDLGATLIVGKTYVVSQTAGGIAPIDDLAVGDFVSHLGIATTASNLKIAITNSGVEVP